MKNSAWWMRGLMVVCAAVLVLTLGFAAEAQTYRGSILGTVMDSSGGSVAGATVTVKNLDTGLTRTVTTGDDGSYKVPELPIGNYSVSVEKAGFRTGIVTSIRVEVASTNRVDVTLQPGEITQKVEVSGEALPQIETTSNTMGGMVAATEMSGLPVNGRDYQKLIFLVPGVAGSPDQITDSPGSYGIFSMNGARGRANNYLLDGTDMNDGYRNDPSINEAGVFGTPATILPVEAVAEMRVLSNFEPEYGRSAGGVINVVTKSGTNEWHGTGLEYFRDKALNARNYFDEASAGPQQEFRNNQFGGSLGGPIRKDGTFFFFDYEGTREHGAQSSPACVPTAVDITTNTPGGGINPVIAAILARNPWPAANLPGSCITNGTDGQTPVTTNAALATPFSNRVDSLIAKVDHNIGKKQMLTGRYYFGDSDQSFPLALVGGGLVPGFNTATPTRVQVVSVSHVYTISSNLVNEARFGLNRFVEGFFPEDRSFDPGTIGLNTGVSAYDFGLPKISVGGFAPIGADNGDPRERVDTNLHFMDNISMNRAGHAVKFGYEMRRTTIWQMFDRTGRGKLSFDNLAAFLAGTPADGKRLIGNTSRNTSQNSHAFYMQDSFRWRKNLTVNYGVRWDYYGVIKEDNGNFTNVDPVTGMGILLNGAGLYAPDKNNFGPRVSLAWDVNGKGKTVIRAGYGFFYDSVSHDMFLGHLPWNSGFDPGPAYAGFGPNPISFAGITGGTLNAAIPVFDIPGASPMGDAFGVDPKMRTPYMQNYNLNLQQEINRYMVLQVGYVGSNGHKLLRFRDINQPSQAEITAADLATTCPNPAPPPLTVPCVADWSVPRHLSASPFWYINWEEASANSTYNSLQLSWKINNWKGLSSTASFNWSHSIDDASDGEDYVPNAAQPNDSTSPIRMNRGNSNFDVRKHLTWNFTYNFPNRKGSMSKLTDGWGVNGIVTVQSGQPFQLNYNFWGDFDGSGGGFGRPDVAGTITYNRNDPRNFLDVSVFAIPCSYPVAGGDGTSATCVPGTRHFGNLGRNSLRGPDFRQFDFSIFKDTKINERIKVQFRAEAFNLFNHPNFANPYLPYFIADASPNGVGTNGRSIGSLGLAATGDVGIGYPFLGSGGPRGLQLAVKFTF
ncbi:MAG: TonB-dependent receptor [Acidobacteriia bacterium]|nr:TonB-dependent receptor [Terriglobia bacterium]